MQGNPLDLYHIAACVKDRLESEIMRHVAASLLEKERETEVSEKLIQMTHESDVMTHRVA